MKEDTIKVGPGQSRDGCADTVSYNNNVDTGLTVMPKDTKGQQAEAEADEPEESPDTARLEPNPGKISGAAGAALGNQDTDMLNGAEENKNDLKGDMPHGRHRKKGKPGKQEKGNRNKGEADGEGTDTPSNCRKTQMEGKNDTGKKQTEEDGPVWKPLGLAGMVGYGILIALPVIGLISAIILAIHFRRDPIRSNFALACLVLRIFYMVMSFLIVLGIVEIVFSMASYMGY